MKLNKEGKANDKQFDLSFESEEDGYRFTDGGTNLITIEEKKSHAIKYVTKQSRASCKIKDI